MRVSPVHSKIFSPTAGLKAPQNCIKNNTFFHKCTECSTFSSILTNFCLGYLHQYFTQARYTFQKQTAKFSDPCDENWWWHSHSPNGIFEGLHMDFWQSLSNHLTNLIISEFDEIHTGTQHMYALPNLKVWSKSVTNSPCHGTLKLALFHEQSSGLNVPKLLACTTPSLNVQSKSCFKQSWTYALFVKSQLNGCRLCSQGNCPPGHSCNVCCVSSHKTAPEFAAKISKLPMMISQLLGHLELRFLVRL